MIKECIQIEDLIWIQTPGYQSILFDFISLSIFVATSLDTGSGSLGTVSKTILLEGLNRLHGANLTLSSDVDQDT